jgi:hypothetical protein
VLTDSFLPSYPSYTHTHKQTPGYKITLVPKAVEEVEAVEIETTANTMMDVNYPEVTKLGGGTMGTDDLKKPVLNAGEIATLSQQIVDDARAQLDALQNGGEMLRKQKTSGALAMAGGMRDRNEGAIPEQDFGGGDEEGGDDGGGGMDE